MEKKPNRNAAVSRGHQITLNPALVQACAELNKAFGRAYLLAGAELCRELSKMMRQPRA